MKYIDLDYQMWEKEDRAKYIEWRSRASTVEDYLEDLIDVWHTTPEELNVSMSEFLGMTWEEFKPFAAKGIVPDRITLMWMMGDY